MKKKCRVCQEMYSDEWTEIEIELEKRRKILKEKKIQIIETQDDNENPRIKVQCHQCSEHYAVLIPELIKGFDCPCCHTHIDLRSQKETNYSDDIEDISNSIEDLAGDIEDYEFFFNKEREADLVENDPRKLEKAKNNVNLAKENSEKAEQLVEEYATEPTELEDIPDKIKEEARKWRQNYTNYEDFEKNYPAKTELIEKEIDKFVKYLNIGSEINGIHEDLHKGITSLHDSIEDLIDPYFNHSPISLSWYLEENNDVGINDVDIDKFHGEIKSAIKYINNVIKNHNLDENPNIENAIEKIIIEFAVHSIFREIFESSNFSEGIEVDKEGKKKDVKVEIHNPLLAYLKKYSLDKYGEEDGIFNMMRLYFFYIIQYIIQKIDEKAKEDLDKYEKEFQKTQSNTCTDLNISGCQNICPNCKETMRKKQIVCDTIIQSLSLALDTELNEIIRLLKLNSRKVYESGDEKGILLLSKEYRTAAGNAFGNMFRDDHEYSYLEILQDISNELDIKTQKEKEEWKQLSPKEKEQQYIKELESNLEKYSIQKLKANWTQLSPEEKKQKAKELIEAFKNTDILKGNVMLSIIGVKSLISIIGSEYSKSIPVTFQLMATKKRLEGEMLL